MKATEYTGQAKTNDKGQLLMSNKAEMFEFFKQHPNKSVIMNFEIVDEKGRKAAMAIYNGKILPGFQAALHRQGTSLTTAGADEAIRAIAISAKGMREEKEVILTLSEMSTQKIWELIEETREFVSREFDEVI